MKQQAVANPETSSSAFPEDLRTALHALRSSIIELLGAVNADPGKPQDLARRFDINKNLAWKISKIASRSDLFAVVPQIPGSAGLRIFFRALADHDAPADLLENADRAAEALDQVVKVHTGDRNTLEIMISSLLPTAVQREQIEQSRKLTYQGMSGTLGVRAKAQIALNVLAPNADNPDLADLAQTAGLVSFRRLRPDARWLLFRRERWSDDDPHPARDVVVSLDDRHPADQGVPLLSEFCSKPIPDIELVSGEGEDQYELPPGPVGNTAALTCIYGQLSSGIGAVYGDHEGEYSEIGCNLITPAEHLILDLLVHRDFEWAMQPEFLLYSRLDGGPMHMAGRRGRNHLPSTETVQDLGWNVAALATPVVPRYGRLVRHVFDRTGWDTANFRAFRVSMAYPPIPSAALLRMELPVR